MHAACTPFAVNFAFRRIGWLERPWFDIRGSTYCRARLAVPSFLQGPSIHTCVLAGAGRVGISRRPVNRFNSANSVKPDGPCGSFPIRRVNLALVVIGGFIRFISEVYRRSGKESTYGARAASPSIVFFFFFLFRPFYFVYPSLEAWILFI